MFKILKGVRKALTGLLNFICFFVSTVGFQSLECAEIKFGTAFNLQHKQSQKFVGCNNLKTRQWNVGAAFAQDVPTEGIDSKTFASRWYFSEFFPVPAVEKTVLGNAVADGASVILRNIDTDFCLDIDRARAGRNMGVMDIWNPRSGLTEFRFIFRKIDDTTFVITDNVSKIIGFENGSLVLKNDSAAIKALPAAVQYHFSIVDPDETYASEMIRNLAASNSNLSAKGCTFLGLNLPVQTGTFKPFFPEELHKIAMALDDKLQPVYIGINSSVDCLVGFNADTKNWPVLNPRRQRSWNDPLVAFRVYTDNTGRIATSTDRVNAINTSWKNPIPLNTPWANWMFDSAWPSQLLSGMLAGVNGNTTLCIDEGPASRLFLLEGNERKDIQTPFAVADATLGADGTIWCLSTEGSVYRINPGSFGYDKSDAAKRDVLIRDLQKPAYVKVAAAGSVDSNIVAVINALGEVFVGANNGELKNLGIKGVVDVAVAQNGGIALVVATSPQRYSGVPWVGNFFSMFDADAGKIAQAQVVANQVGAYGDYLDIPIMISQNGKYLSVTDDGALSAAATKADPDNSFTFEQLGDKVYSIKFGNEFLAVSKDYQLSLVESLGEGQSAEFFVYGGTKNAAETRIQHKDRFLTFATDGTVSLSTTEAKCKFESTNDLAIATGALAARQLAAEKKRLELEQAAAVDKISREMGALQAKMVAAKIDSDKKALQTQIDALVKKMDELKVQQEAALKTKAAMQAKLDAIETERVAQEKMINDKIAALQAQIAATTDPLVKLDLQKQIDAFKSSKGSLADVIMQNVKVMADQSRQEAELMTKKANLEKEIANIERNAKEAASAAKQALSGDINNMLVSIMENTRKKIASALGVAPELLAVKLSTNPAIADLAALATLVGKTADEISNNAVDAYAVAADKVFETIKSDIEKLGQLASLDPKQVVAAFKEDLGRFAPTVGLDAASIVEKIAMGFGSLIRAEKIKQLQALMAAKTVDTEKAAIKTRIDMLTAGQDGPLSDKDSTIGKEIQAKETAVENDFNNKIDTSFTKIPTMLGSAWKISKELVVRVINYDVLEAQYTAELEKIAKVRDAKRAELLAAVDSGETDASLTAKLKTAVDAKMARNPEGSRSDAMMEALRNTALFNPDKFGNQQLRWMLRQYMDDRAEQQAVIDAGITDLRKKMAVATTSQDMEAIIAKVKAFKSNNDEILNQLRDNDVKIFANERQLTIQNTEMAAIEQKIQAIKKSQEVFMQQAVEDKQSFESSINKALENYAKQDDAYVADLAKIDAMPLATAEGIVAQQKARGELQDRFFAGKRAAITNLQELTTNYLAAVEKIKSSVTENIKELEGQQRILTQDYDKALAAAALDKKPVNPKVVSDYQASIKVLDEQIAQLNRIIDSKNFESNKVQKDNMDRLKAFNDQIREASEKQIEQMRYYMLRQGDAEKQASSQRIARIQADNKKMIDDVNAMYEETKAKLRANADAVKNKNEKYIADLNKSLADHQARFAARQGELEAGKTLAENQKKVFLAWKERIQSALDAKINMLNLTSATYRDTVNSFPNNFDSLIDDSLNVELRQVLPNVPKLLDIIGLKTTMSVREELIREAVVTDLKKQIDSSDFGIGKMFAVGVTTGAGKETYGYMERDASRIIVRNVISILTNLGMKFLRRGTDLVSIEHSEKEFRMTLGQDGAINFEAFKDSKDKDGNEIIDPSQLFKIEYGAQAGTFLLSSNNQYLVITGEITASSTDKSARFVLGNKSSAAKFIAFKMPTADFEEDFKILTEGLPLKLKEFKASMPIEEFKARTTAFKNELATGFARIEQVRNNFVNKLESLFGDDDAVQVDEQNAAESARIDSELVFAKDSSGKKLQGVIDLRDPQTQSLLQELIDRDPALAADASTKDFIVDFLKEAFRQVDLSARIVKEQNYRVAELRKIYLKTTVEKNHEIGFLEADSRWQKFQWARDIYLLIQLQLDASERDRLEFDKEMQAVKDKSDAQMKALEDERTKTITNLKATLDEKIAASQRARQEMQKLAEEKKRIFDEHMAKMQSDLSKLQGEELAQRNASIRLLQETNAAQMQDLDQKYANQLEQLRLDQERAQTLATLKTAVLQRKILNAQQYIISFKIDSGAEVTLSHKMQSNGEVWYVTRSTLDDLELAKNIRFDQNTRFKLVKQDDESFSIETLDGARRITLVDRQEVDLLAAKDVESQIPDQKGKMVADPTQKFFIEGTQADGVVIRDLNKIGYIGIKEVLSNLNDPQSKKISVLTFTASKAALDNAAAGKGDNKETLFDVANFSKGSNTINELLNGFYVSQDRRQSDEAVKAANEFFNKNKIFNYPHLMDGFVLALTEFGQGRVSTGLMTESALKDINEFIYQISESFMFATNEGGQLVTAGGSIKLLDSDFVEPILLEDGQFIVISSDGKRLTSVQQTGASGSSEIEFVDGKVFDRVLNLKIVATDKKNTVALLDYEGKKRLSFKDNIFQWTDASQSMTANDMFAFSGTRAKASILVQDLGLIANTQEGGRVILQRTNNFDDSKFFQVSIVQPNTFESMLINQGLPKYTDSAESKKVIDAITAKLQEVIESKQFEDDDKNAFLSTFANYLEGYVSAESLTLWGAAVKKAIFVAKQEIKKIDSAVLGKLLSVVQEFSVQSGAYLVLKNLQEGKYLAVNDAGQAEAQASAEVSRNMLFKVLRDGDQYALIAMDGTGGYLTAGANGLCTAARAQASGKPNADQLFWLVGFGNQLSIKLASTPLQTPEGFLVIHPNQKLASWNLDNPEEKTKYTLGNARTKFEVQILDETSLLRGIINQGPTAATKVFLEGLMATRENSKLTDDQQSLVAQQQFKDFEEFVLTKQVLPARKQGGDPVVRYNLKPKFEELRRVQTDEEKGMYSLKDTLQYIEEYVFYDPTAKAGIKMGKIGETIFAAMKEAFSEMRLFDKTFDDKMLNSIINPGNQALQFDAAGVPAQDYIGAYLDGLIGNETDVLKTSPVLYRYVLNLARVLYSAKYVDNTPRFNINAQGKLLDRNNVEYSLTDEGSFVSKDGKIFEELAAELTDPKTGKLIAPEEDFAPGIKIIVSGEGAARKARIEFSAKNSKGVLVGDSQMTPEVRAKIMSVLDRFIDGQSRVLSVVENAREFISRVQADTLVPAFIELKDTLDKQFKANASFKEEALQTMLRKIRHKAASETVEWRREMLTSLFEFVGTKAWFEKLEDGSFELRVQEGASKVIYNKKDILDTIDSVRRLLMEVKLLEGQISISEKYDNIINKSIELFFKYKYKDSAKQLTQFVDDNKPKDWRKDDVPKIWFNKVSPLPGDGMSFTRDANMFDRSKAWNEEKPVYSIRLLTEEQQRMRMNLLDYVNAGIASDALLNKAAKK